MSEVGGAATAEGGAGLAGPIGWAVLAAMSINDMANGKVPGIVDMVSPFSFNNNRWQVPVIQPLLEPFTGAWW